MAYQLFSEIPQVVYQTMTILTVTAALCVAALIAIPRLTDCWHARRRPLHDIEWGYTGDEDRLYHVNARRWFINTCRTSFSRVFGITRQLWHTTSSPQREDNDNQSQTPSNTVVNSIGSLDDERETNSSLHTLNINVLGSTGDESIVLSVIEHGAEHELRYIGDQFHVASRLNGSVGGLLAEDVAIENQDSPSVVNSPTEDANAPEAVEVQAARVPSQNIAWSSVGVGSTPLDLRHLAIIDELIETSHPPFFRRLDTATEDGEFPGGPTGPSAYISVDQDFNRQSSIVL
ncbi:hypothetical protein F4819DRAFT_277889 [Hypoxylon fuscum]|nr:hypothetical protein F4819DRAFT_277889 [Hypoxylon fuscum]